LFHAALRSASGHLLCVLLTFTALCPFVPQKAACQSAGTPANNQSPAMAVVADDAAPLAFGRLVAETQAAPKTFIASDENSETENERAPREVTESRQKVESDLTVEGLASYGNYRIFASGSDCKLYTAGVEYDRHSWGYLLKARFDYVAEFLPLVLLNEPAKEDVWGDPLSYNRKIVPGIAFSPIGFRLLWRSKKAIKPYLTWKGGMIGFTHKVLSQQATYESFTFQAGTGVNVKVKERWDLRLGLFSDFHFSDAFIVPVNPGIDVMNANLGLTYHF
jgi:hypothetical protein